MLPRSSTFLPCIVLALFALAARGAELKLNGSSYIYYNMQKAKVKVFGDSETLFLNFKTINPTGLLFFGHGSTGQYLSLELIHGKLRYTINLANGGMEKAEPYSLTHGDKLCDNKWHSLRIMRNKGKLHVYLDSDKTKIYNIKLPSYQRQYELYLDTGYYVGGKWRGKNGFKITLAKNFNGCLRDLLFNTYNPISDAQQLAKPEYEITGRPLSYKCPETKFEPITFTSNMGMLKIPTSTRNRASASFSFRTYDPDGILFYRDGPKASVYLYLKNGKLSFDFLVGLQAPFTLDTSTFVRADLNDGEWHTVRAAVDARFMAVEVDHVLGVNTSAHFDHKKALAFENLTYVGGGTYYREMHGFVGCMRDLRVNGDVVDLVHLSKPAGIVANLVSPGQCSLTSLCHPTACRYRSKCVQKLNNYTCECRRFYNGRHCEIPQYQATCQKYRELGVHEDSYCLVDPDSAGPLPEFRVLCNMTAQPDALTIVNHTRAGRVVRVAGTDAKFSTSRESYVQLLKYGGIDRLNLRALVDSSDHCRQYVQFDCVNTKFFEHDPDLYGASWFSTDGQQKYYWGGASTGTGCACSETGSCQDSTKTCNCDIGDDIWRRDAGYITMKSDLPVIGIYFPETAEMSNFTVGPLECFGRKKQLTRDIGQRKYVDIACQPLATTPAPIYPWRTGKTEEKPWPSVNMQPTTSSEQPKNTTTGLGNEETVPVTELKRDKNTTTRLGDTEKPKNIWLINSTDGVQVDVSSSAHSGQNAKSWVLIVIIAGSSVLFVVVLALLLVVVRHKRANGVWCKGLFTFPACGQHQQLPKIEIYRHSMGTDEPDILHMGDLKNSKVIDLHFHRGHFVPKKSSQKKKKMVTFQDETC